MENWDYKKMGDMDFFLQKSWNQTVVTKLNEISKESELPITINVSENLSPLMESLYFYQNGMIGDKYVINYVDSTQNIIEVEGVILEVLNFNE